MPLLFLFFPLAVAEHFSIFTLGAVLTFEERVEVLILLEGEDFGTFSVLTLLDGVILVEGVEFPEASVLTFPGILFGGLGSGLGPGFSGGVLSSLSDSEIIGFFYEVQTH